MPIYSLYSNFDIFSQFQFLTKNLSITVNAAFDAIAKLTVHIGTGYNNRIEIVKLVLVIL